MSDDFNPMPAKTLDALPFWDGCAQGRLLIQRCAACARFQHYPRSLCTRCTGTDLSFEEVSGHGTVVTFTVCDRPLGARFVGRTPYVVALVDLAEGPRLMTNIVGCAATDVTIGMQVRVGFEDLGQGTWLPVFEPAASS
jgi:hypothetical protein